MACPGLRTRDQILKFVLVWVLTTGVTHVMAAEPAPALIPHNQDQAPNAFKSPEEAARSMKVPPGFSVEVVASEPAIVNPVAMTFDERGRIWITESLEYPRRSAGPGRDRIKILEDTDGDGRAEKVTVFAEGLNIPSGIAVGHGGVWVVNSPDLLFLQDTDGDDKADRTEVVVTGFGRDDTHELPNSLTWGPDGWLYGWNGVFNRSKIKARDGKTYEFTCAIFRVHPKTRDFNLFCEGTSNPWGLAIDSQGSFFASACVIDHLWHLAETGYYIRQGGPYPPHTWPMGSIVSHSHQKAAYCGLTYFDSPAYPPEYRGKLFMGNIHANGLNVDRIEHDGSTYRSEPDSDFLRANDSWFMPVSQKTGPDGSLYVLDWYDRYHCYQDANRDPAGIDRLRGRLYRIRHGDTPQRSKFNLASLDNNELIGLLSSANVYDRDIAQRLLTERQAQSLEDSTRAKLQELVLKPSSSKEGRMHALWVLVGSGPLRDDFHQALLSNADSTLRLWGVRAAGNQATAKAPLSDQVRGRVLTLAKDPSPDVRLQVAIAIRKLMTDKEAASRLLDVLLVSGDDRLIPHIVWQNLHRLPEARLLEVVDRIDPKDAGSNHGLLAILPRLMDRLLDVPNPNAARIGILLRHLVRSNDREAIRDAIDRLVIHLRQAEKSGSGSKPLRDALSAAIRPTLDPSKVDDPTQSDLLVLMAYLGDSEGLRNARTILEDPEGRDNTRALAFEAISFNGSWETVRPLIVRLLADRSASLSTEAQSRVIAALGARNETELAHELMSVHSRLMPEIQPRAVALLTQRPGWTKVLLDRVKSKELPAHVLDVNQIRRLQASKDAEIAKQVRSIWGTIREGRNQQREQVAQQMRMFLTQTAGDPSRGEAVFRRICAQCHKIHGSGQEVGPDLTSNGRNDFTQLLSNVFDPSLVIGDAYESTTIATDDGRILTGLLVEEGADRILLKLAGGKVEAIPRAQVDQMKTASISLMPEGLEQQMSPQDIADLFTFLSFDKHHSDPTARRLPGSGPIAPSEAPAATSKRKESDK